MAALLALASRISSARWEGGAAWPVPRGRHGWLPGRQRHCRARQLPCPSGFLRRGGLLRLSERLSRWHDGWAWISRGLLLRGGTGGWVSRPGRASSAQNGGRVSVDGRLCQDRVNKLARIRPLPERSCSLSGRFTDHHRDAIQGPGAGLIRRTSEVGLACIVFEQRAGYGVAPGSRNGLELWLVPNRSWPGRSSNAARQTESRARAARRRGHDDSRRSLRSPVVSLLRSCRGGPAPRQVHDDGE